MSSVLVNQMTKKMIDVWPIFLLVNIEIASPFFICLMKAFVCTTDPQYFSVSGIFNISEITSSLYEFLEKLARIEQSVEQSKFWSVKKPEEGNRGSVSKEKSGWSLISNFEG